MKRPSKSIVVFSILTAMLWGEMLVSASSVTATEYSRAALLFLLISPSARINGMGLAGVAVPDEPMGYYNPAAPALYAREYNISRVAYTERTRWLPPFSGPWYFYSGIQIGADLTALRSFFRGNKEGMASDPARLLRRLKQDVSVVVALSRYKTEFDMGTQIRTNEYGVEIGSFRGMDKATNTAISVNAHFLADFSAGMTLIDYESRLGFTDAGQARIAEGNARNYGLMMRLPLIKAFETLSNHKIRLSNGIRPTLVSTYGVTWNNRGDDVLYTGFIEADPLPRNKETGYTIEFGVALDCQNISMDLFRELRTYAKEKTQIPASVGCKAKSDVMDKSGTELEVLETFVLRSGKYDDDPGHVHINTSGITIKSDGLLKLFGTLHSGGKNADQGILHFIARHFSMAWHKSKYQDNDSPVDGTEFEQITISLSF